MNMKLDLDADEMEGVRPEVISRFAPSRASSKPGQPNAAEMVVVRRFNLACYRLVHGKGDMSEEIAVLTGLSRKAVERRVYRASKTSTEQELSAEGDGLASMDLTYMRRRYARTDDPAVAEFMNGVMEDSWN